MGVLATFCIQSRANACALARACSRSRCVFSSSTWEAVRTSQSLPRRLK